MKKVAGRSSTYHYAAYAPTCRQLFMPQEASGSCMSSAGAQLIARAGKAEGDAMTNPGAEGKDDVVWATYLALIAPNGAVDGQA